MMTGKLVIVCQSKRFGSTCTQKGCEHHLSRCPFNNLTAPEACPSYAPSEPIPSLNDVFKDLGEALSKIDPSTFTPREPRKARRQNVVNSPTVRGILTVLKDFGYEVEPGDYIISRLARLGYEEAWSWTLLRSDGHPPKIDGCLTEVGSQWGATAVIKAHKEGRVEADISQGDLHLNLVAKR